MPAAWDVPLPLGPPLRLRRGSVPESLPGARRCGPWLASAGDEALVRLPGLRLLVRGGVEAVLDCPEEDEGAAVYGWAARVALTQRRVPTLHASVVARDGQALALVGHPMAGKSTTALALVARGWRLVADDLGALDLSPTAAEAGVRVAPYARPVHLTPEAAGLLGVPAGQGRDLPGRVKARYDLPVIDHDLPLAGVVELMPGPGAAPPQGHRLAGLAAFVALREHMRVAGLAEGPEHLDWFVPAVGRIARLPVYRLPRGRDRVQDPATSLAAMADAVAAVAVAATAAAATTAATAATAPAAPIPAPATSVAPAPAPATP